MHKILIANRGEIAVRVIRTARDLGYRTVAVYSEADAGALHTEMADEAVCIGKAPVGASYLNPANVIAAAQRTGAQGVHPGYGFLSENAAFARACADAGLVFIGPPADAIELMGSKRLSKLAMLEAGVPCIPGYQGADQDDATLVAEAEKIGFPIMVKASAGGGGRGMRLVEKASDLPAALKTARSEAEGAFGSGELILEKAVVEPRHIEIQVFADSHGNAVHLFERDCSIQRRHQKVVEEAPSPFMTEALRAKMGAAAVAAAKACDYQGAGTVEFLVDKDRSFYFLEMNTRLQVEHPVTELITGQDLVAWQLAVAEGDPLPCSQDELSINGHAIEVRLYGEDPCQDFLPQTGDVLHWQFPLRDGVRVDHGLKAGHAVSPHYDPMVAKIMAWGPTRRAAARRLSSAINDTALLGVTSNRLFLQNIVSSDAFLDGPVTTAFLAQHFAEDPSLVKASPSFATLARMALLFHLRAMASGPQPAQWGSAAPANVCLRLQVGEDSVELHLSFEGNRCRITMGDEAAELAVANIGETQCAVIEDGRRWSFSYFFSGDTLYLDDGTGHHVAVNVTHAPAAAAGAAGDGQIKAPMDGVIVDLLAAEGEAVSAGDTLAVMEAMKMEHALKADVSGTVTVVATSSGEQVKTGQLLITVEPEEAP